MTDATTHTQISIHTDGTAGPYLMVVTEQLAAVEDALKDAGISFWTDRDAISLNGEETVAVINLGRGADVDRVRQVLDEAEDEGPNDAEG